MVCIKTAHDIFVCYDLKIIHKKKLQLFATYLKIMYP